MAKPITPEQLARNDSEDGHRYNEINGDNPKHIAKILNQSRYKSEADCPKCGYNVRYTKSNVCIECHRIKMSKPLSEEEKHKRRLRWNADSENINLKRRELHKSDPSKNRTRQKQWLSKNPNKALSYNVDHSEKRKELTYKWRLKNQNKLKEYAKRGCHNRRARLKNSGGVILKNQLSDKILEQRFECYWCYESLWVKWHPDHVIPLSKNGSNDINNVVISCVACNLQKGSKLPEEWFAHPLCRSKRKW